MKIETKFNLGDRVWRVYEYKGEVHVYSAVIAEIIIDNDSVSYVMNDGSLDDFKEDILIPYEDNMQLMGKIIGLDKEIQEKGSEEK